MKAERYESAQQRILRPAADIYSTLSDFSRFTPILEDKVEEWTATEDTCSFRVKGITARLRIIDKQPHSLIKITGDDGTPFDFTFWLQLKEAAPYDTRMRVVVEVELNMMMRMMIGGKIQGAVDKIASTIADAFNGTLQQPVAS